MFFVSSLAFWPFLVVWHSTINVEKGYFIILCELAMAITQAQWNIWGQWVETVQDFLIKLGIKPRLHILKIGIFSLNYVIVRPTKIMNNLLKVCKIFRHQKPTESFLFFFL